MALDSRILLQAGQSVPQFDLMTNLQKGLEARQTIQDAPLLRKLQEAKLAEFQRKAELGVDSIQQAVAIPGVGFQTLTRGGDVGIKSLTPEQQSLFNQAAQAEAERKALAAGLKTKTTEEEKLRVQRDLKPQITMAVKLAELEAKGRGETLDELGKMNAALPGLTQVTDKLKEVSEVMSTTFGARGFDFVAREAGFGSTKGATARAKFTSIVGNEIIPLLKITFGSAFTKAEGDELKATLGDPNLGHEERVAQLDSFIEAKKRQIETKQREIGAEPAEALSDEDLFKKYGI